MLELTEGKPALHLGTMIVNDSALGHDDGGIFHCVSTATVCHGPAACRRLTQTVLGQQGREDVDLSGTEGEVAALYAARGMVPGQPTNRAPFRGSVTCEERNGRMFCDNFVVFPYLDDVGDGDGGLMILPGRCAHPAFLLDPRLRH